MTEQQFAYWLQGFAELNEQPPTAEQWKLIRDHLALVFKKVTPQMGAKVPDLKDSPEIKDLIERARKERVVEPPSAPYQPYFLDQSIRPGEITCYC